MKTAAAPTVDPNASAEAPETDETQVRIPKTELPDCQVGEMLKIVGEDDENFIVSPSYEEAGAGEGAGESEGGLPPAVKAIMGK
jgi:hypothetical protein